MKNKLVIPWEILKQHIATLGKTGKGKSSVMRYIVEYLLREKKRVCIIDPKGDWWGIKSSADGKSAGFPVVAFGDFIEAKASDVPINEHSGREVAQLIASGNRPCVIGFRGWTHGAMVRFWIDFAQGLFHHNTGELYLVGDEFHNFAPKGKVLDVDAGKCLHWSNRLLSEGRGIGLVCLIASQRPQKVHNDTLTCCETLITMGVNHPADRAAVKDWVDGCGDKEKGNLVLNSLAGLQRGEAFVWSPEIGYGPERVSFPKFETFDSFAPPQLQAKISDQGWANVNLEEVKTKLAGVIEEAKKNDPKELQRQISELKRQLEIARTRPMQEKPEVREVPVIEKEHLAALAELVMQLHACEQSYLVAHGKGTCVANMLSKLFGKIGLVEGEPIRPLTPVSKSIPRPELKRQTKPSNDPLESVSFVGDLTGTRTKIIDTIGMLRARGLTPNREMIARWLGIHPTGGRYCSDLAALRAAGYLDGCALTEKGEDAANELPTGLDAARQALDGTEQNIFDSLANGQEHNRETLAAVLGIHPTGGRYCSNLARMRKMGLIPERGRIKLTEAAYK